MELSEGWKNAKGKPPIVCLCGSTRFLNEFFEAGWKFTLRGYIVVSIGVVKTSSADKDGGHGAEAISQECADMLDELHRRKIDIADEVFVINRDGYIGKSTAAEIEYANENDKPITYMELPHPTNADGTTTPSPDKE